MHFFNLEMKLTLIVEGLFWKKKKKKAIFKKKHAFISLFRFLSFCSAAATFLLTQALTLCLITCLKKLYIHIYIHIYIYGMSVGIKRSGEQRVAWRGRRCEGVSFLPLKATKSHFRCSIFIYTAPSLCFFIHTVGGRVEGWREVGGRVGWLSLYQTEGLREMGWGGRVGLKKKNHLH